MVGSPPTGALLAIGRWAYGTYDPVMSYNVHLFRFQSGECMDIDASRLMEMIQPLIVWREEEHDYVRLRAADGGEADLYGVCEDATTLMFSHWSGGGHLRADGEARAGAGHGHRATGPVCDDHR